MFVIYVIFIFFVMYKWLFFFFYIFIFKLGILVFDLINVYFIYMDIIVLLYMVFKFFV